mgnify:CR=1 FL=1
MLMNNHALFYDRLEIIILKLMGSFLATFFPVFGLCLASLVQNPKLYQKSKI